MKKNNWILGLLVLAVLGFQSCSKKEGCTDVTACNFEEDAEKDDGSCDYSQTTYYQDLDGDGDGNPAVSTTACSQPDGYVTSNTDENDHVPAPEQKQRAVNIYVGATWCGPCGAYGEPIKEHLHGNDDVVLLNTPSSDQLINGSHTFSTALGGGYAQAFGVNTIPSAYWGGHGYTTTANGFSGVLSTDVDYADNQIATITANSPAVAIGAYATTENDSVVVDVKLNVLQAASAEHYVTVILLEDGIQAVQQITGAPSATLTHNNVVRNGYGYNPPSSTTIFSSIGTPSVGMIEDLRYAVKTESSWNVNKVAVVVFDGGNLTDISNAIIVPVN